MGVEVASYSVRVLRRRLVKCAYGLATCCEGAPVIFYWLQLASADCTFGLMTRSVGPMLHAFGLCMQRVAFYQQCSRWSRREEVRWYEFRKRFRRRCSVKTS